MDVLGNAGARSFAQIHAEIQSVGAVDATQRRFCVLREHHHLLCGIGGEFRKRIEMEIGHDEKVSGGVGVGVEADEAVSAAMDDVGGLFGSLLLHSVCNGIVGGRNHIAEDTVLILCGRPIGKSGRDAGAGLCVRASDVAVTPGGPETIHISASIAGVRTLKAYIATTEDTNLIGTFEEFASIHDYSSSNLLGPVNDAAVKLLRQTGGLVDVNPSKFYAFR